MWDNRCKVAVSGVGFSKVTRSADIPLAAEVIAKGGCLKSLQEKHSDDGHVLQQYREWLL